MSEIRHTPGPWAFDGDNAVMADVGANICTVSMAGDFPCIDDDEGDNRINVDIECTANARLIAAAPELLEALTEALQTLQIASRQLSEDHRMVLSGRRWGWRTIAKIEGAIAKAEGRT